MPGTTTTNLKVVRCVVLALQKTPELMAHIDLKEDGASIGTDYNLFAVSQPMLHRLGTFDENIWPAYFEVSCQR